MNQVFVFGEGEEALLCTNRMVADPTDCEALRMQYSQTEIDAWKAREITLISIAEITNDSLRHTLGELHTRELVISDSITTYEVAINDIFTAFQSAWNSYMYENYKTGLELSVEDALEWWNRMGRKLCMPQDGSLSDSMAFRILENANKGVTVQQMQEKIRRSMSRINIYTWESMIFKAFRDGWNAARLTLKGEKP